MLAALHVYKIGYYHPIPRISKNITPAKNSHE